MTKDKPKKEKEKHRGEVTPEEMQSAHPVEPAEGAREPGENASAPRPRHPSQPAEGEREPDDEPDRA